MEVCRADGRVELLFGVELCLVELFGYFVVWAWEADLVFEQEMCVDEQAFVDALCGVGIGVEGDVVELLWGKFFTVAEVIEQGTANEVVEHSFFFLLVGDSSPEGGEGVADHGDVDGVPVHYFVEGKRVDRTVHVVFQLFQKFGGPVLFSFANGQDGVGCLNNGLGESKYVHVGVCGNVDCRKLAKYTKNLVPWEGQGFFMRGSFLQAGVVY